MAEALSVFARWLHIASAVTLIGGLLYASMVMMASAEALAQDSAETLVQHAAARFRPLVWTAIGALILSGIYNLITTPGHSPRYKLLLAIKLLLVAHVFASALLAVRPMNDRRKRQMTSAFISGLIIIAISAYLRRIF